MSECELKMVKDFNELLGTGGAGPRSDMSVFSNMSPVGGARSAVNRELDAREYQFMELPPKDGHYKVAAIAMDGTHPPVTLTDEFSTKRDAEIKLTKLQQGQPWDTGGIIRIESTGHGGGL